MEIRSIKCPYCGFGGVYARTDNSFRCKKCGDVWQKPSNPKE